MAPREFLHLPHEIRHNIYRAYFTLTDGYVYQPEYDKLVAADGQRLDLALMYTCRFIASETKDLPLQHNVVTFSTVYLPEWRTWAARFDYLLRAQLMMQTRLLIQLGGSGFIAPEIYTQIEDRFPWFKSGLEYAVMNEQSQYDQYRGGYVEQVCCSFGWSIFDTVTSRDDIMPPGMKGSRYETSQAVKFALRLVARGLTNDSNESLSRWLSGWEGREGLLQFLDNSFEPWDIPTFSELESMGKRFDDDSLWSRLQEGWEGDCNAERPGSYRSKYRFSATAVAIRFLNGLPATKLRSMKALVLNEDHVAVGYQECHSHGLVALCKENPRLRIELRASLPTNLFLAANMMWDAEEFQRQARRLDLDGIHHLNPESLFETLSQWSTEALATVDAGMPAGSYSLVFCGQPCLDLCTDVFQHVVQRDAAFYMALQRCFPGLLDRHDRVFFSDLDRRAIEAFEHTVNQTSIMRCNFHPGHLWDVEKFVQDFAGRHYDNDQAGRELFDMLLERDTSRFDLPSTMPRWSDLMMENYECRD
ncbi:hypothetical protein FBULB1_2481 [Fusarium bulbicola]|nr:hypothetical protein FBULB1_2481 [Fusarium bulbicola]